MNKLLKGGILLAQKIDAAYEELDIVNEYFFNQFHDNMLIQKDCAWQEVGELEVYSENLTTKYGRITGKDGADSCIKNLEATLKYCNAVIKLQEQSKVIPECIFG